MRVIAFVDEPLLVDAFLNLFGHSKDLDILGVCRSTVDLLAAAVEKRPELALLSLTPEVHIGLIRKLRDTAPDCRIVLWTHNIPKELALQAMEIGVRGILPSTYSPEMILKCLEKVHSGELWFDKALLSSFMGCRKIPLTPRQAQLVRLLAEGLKNKEIAVLMSVTESTVKVYLSRLFEKVGAKDRFELALFGLRNLQGTEGKASENRFGGHELRYLYLDLNPRDSFKIEGLP